MEDAVKITGLTKRYKDLTAVDNLDLTIKQGEIFGLLGPNGSGKSTIISCLLRLLRFEKGDIEVFGKTMTENSYDIKRNIGVVFQDVAVFNELNVRDNIDYFCGLYIPDKALRKQCVDAAIEFVGLREFVKFPPKKLSGGLLRRLNIACGVAHKPMLIILDEPTVAVDPQSRNNILSGIEKLNKDGATVLYTSHYMEEVEQLCTRMAIMDSGRIIAQGTAAELKAMVGGGEKITLTIPTRTEEAAKLIRGSGAVTFAEAKNETVIIKASEQRHTLLAVLELLKTSGIEVESAVSTMPSLNDVFLEITGKELRDNV